MYCPGEIYIILCYKTAVPTNSYTAHAYTEKEDKQLQVRQFSAKGKKIRPGQRSHTK